MTCPNCGMEMPEGSVSCPSCGYQAEPAAPDFDAAPAYSAAPEKKSHGALIGIIIGVIVVIAAIVAVLVIFVFGGNKTDGKYVCDTFSAFGMDFYLDVDGDKVDMVMSFDANGDGTISDDERETESGTIKFDGDVCTITMEGESLDCPYDKKEGTITMTGEEMMGMEIVFTKEK